VDFAAGHEVGSRAPGLRTLGSASVMVSAGGAGTCRDADDDPILDVALADRGPGALRDPAIGLCRQITVNPAGGSGLPKAEIRSATIIGEFDWFQGLMIGATSHFAIRPPDSTAVCSSRR